MRIQQLLLQNSEQLREYCKTLSSEDKHNLYKQLVDEAKGKKLMELGELSELAAVVEEETPEEKRLEYFGDNNNPFNAKAIKSFFGKLLRRLMLIMHSSTCDKDLKELNELDKLLPKMHEELKLRLTNNMHLRNYAERELRFSNFLRDNINVFRLLEEAEHGSVEQKKKATIELIRLLTIQPELNYRGDEFILDLILGYIKVFGKEVRSLESNINVLINLLEESIERKEMEENLDSDIKASVDWLKKRMEESTDKREVESLKSDISAFIDILDKRIEEFEKNEAEKCRNEAEKTEKEVMDKRNKVVGQLSRFRLNKLS